MILNAKKKIAIALIAVFACGAAIVVYAYFAGADKRAIEKTIENVRTGVRNADPNLVLAQISSNYNYDGYDYKMLETSVPQVLKRYTALDINLSNMEIRIEDGHKQAHATFHFVIMLSVRQVMGVTIEGEIALSGDADLTLAKESGEWKITEVSARDKSGMKIRLP